MMRLISFLALVTALVMAWVMALVKVLVSVICISGISECINGISDGVSAVTLVMALVSFLRDQCIRLLHDLAMVSFWGNSSHDC